MSNLTTYKKPELAVISELKKLREYSNTERLTIAKSIVDSLINRLGVGGKSDASHHLESIRYISNNKEFTPDEFTKAFELAIDGELKIDLFQQLNCVVIGRVMNLYKAYKIEKLRAYRQRRTPEKPLTPNEQKQLISDAIKDEFTNYKFSGKLNENRNYLYDELKKSMDVEDKFKKVAWKHAVKEIRAVQEGLSKRDQADTETLKAKCIIRYKQKLVAILFDRYTTYEQLKAKIL